MKSLFVGAVSALALAASAQAADAPQFDLYRSSDAAQSLIAIVAVGDAAPFAVASGADKAALDILSGDAAASAILDLKAKTETTQIADAEAAIVKEVKKSKKEKKGADAAEAHEVVLVKQATDEGQEPKVERKIIKLDRVTEPSADAATSADASADAKTDAIATADAAMAADEDLAKFAQADGGKVFVIEKTENGAPMRLVKIAAVGADSARAFIDQNAGLDDAEKATIKTTLGL
jgi:hypothetical protein